MGKEYHLLKKFTKGVQPFSYNHSDINLFQSTYNPCLFLTFLPGFPASEGQKSLYLHRSLLAQIRKQPEIISPADASYTFPYSVYKLDSGSLFLRNLRYMNSPVREVISSAAGTANQMPVICQRAAKRNASGITSRIPLCKDRT